MGRGRAARGQSRLVVGPSRNRLLLRLLGRERFLEVVVAIPQVYHVAEVLRGSGIETTPRRWRLRAIEESSEESTKIPGTSRRTGMPKMTSAMYTTMPMVIQVAAPTPV